MEYLTLRYSMNVCEVVTKRPNVKNINHITKSIEIVWLKFLKIIEQNSKKWDDLKLFITYGMLSEKFYERAENLLCLSHRGQILHIRRIQYVS